MTTPRSISSSSHFLKSFVVCAAVVLVAIAWFVFRASSPEAIPIVDRQLARDSANTSTPPAQKADATPASREETELPPTRESVASERDDVVFTAHVVDPLGNPVRGLMVTAKLEGSGLDRHVDTDAQGNAIFTRQLIGSMLAGASSTSRFVVYATARTTIPDRTVLGTNEFVSGRCEFTTDPRCRVEIELLANGKRITDDVFVSLERVPSDPLDPVMQRRSLAVKTTIDGFVVFEGLDAGIDVEVQARYSDVHSEPVVLRPGRTDRAIPIRCILALAAIPHLRMRLIGADGKPCRNQDLAVDWFAISPTNRSLRKDAFDRSLRSFETDDQGAIVLPIPHPLEPGNLQCGLALLGGGGGRGAHRFGLTIDASTYVNAGSDVDYDLGTQRVQGAVRIASGSIVQQTVVPGNTMVRLEYDALAPSYDPMHPSSLFARPEADGSFEIYGFEDPRSFHVYALAGGIEVTRKVTGAGSVTNLELPPTVSRFQPQRIR